MAYGDDFDIIDFKNVDVVDINEAIGCEDENHADWNGEMKYILYIYLNIVKCFGLPNFERQKILPRKLFGDALLVMFDYALK